MGNNYKQLNIEDRVMIGILKAEGKSLRDIAVELGRSHSTISRELKRNSSLVEAGKYFPLKAGNRADKRKRESGERERLKSHAIRRCVERNLKRGWSPEQIAGRLKLKFPKMYVCHESIYQYIYDEAVWLIGYLPRRHKKRYAKGHSRKHCKSHIPNRISIAERSEDVNERKEFGHWEADSIVSSASKSALNVLVERKTRYMKVSKLKGKTSKQTRNAITRRLNRNHQESILSITYDNGSENVEHEVINAKLGTKSYFCAPYRSWEKGTVENSCGLVRRFIPKKTDIAKIAVSEIRKMERMLNNRPRKCLGYETPAEVFARLCGALAG